ncbi:unnamed protein product [Bursaphelenchus okinawaensis]|uniref:peptidyl-tRNA hydrolase n=1 Tax=Bursaphelenchus okinawaensis TaxID=465554 RepID=A0A811L6E5_9BILA|nr:unnamed protein product [Bursaphelenchus okinawaensis]CAG9118830.1 unnamed protein product [Bursaphelenchus okinawaensis]
MSYKVGGGKSGLQLTRVGLPFFAIVLGSAYFLKHFQQVRYDFRKVKKEQENLKEFKAKLSEEGIRVKEKPVSLEEVYDEITKLDTENWSNIRGPRAEEDSHNEVDGRSSKVMNDFHPENPENENPPEPRPNRDVLPDPIVEPNDIPVEPGASLSDPQEPLPPTASSAPEVPGAPSEVPANLPSVPSVPSAASSSVPAAPVPSSASVQLSQQPSSSTSHPNDPSLQELEVDSEKLAQLLELGFDELISELALKRTKGKCLDATIDWIVDHSNQSDLEDDSEDSGEESGDEGISGVVEKSVAVPRVSAEELQAAMGGVLSGQAEAAGTSAMARQELVSIMKALRPARTHKMVFVANMSLKMGAGKLAAQVGHATLGVYKYAQRSEEGKAALDAWQGHGAVKVVVKGQSTEQLIDMFKQAKDLGLHAYLVQDAGYTQIPPGSRTILGLFGPVEDVDKVSGTLKLL